MCLTLDGSYKRCINRVNPLGTKGLLAESVAELVRVLWGAQYTFVSPITFRVSEMHPRMMRVVAGY